MEKNTELKISVIIPMYNAADTIEAALDSVKKQTYKCEYQILVINDGSKDKSQAVVEEYIAKNKGMNITLINQTNGGVSKARNTGLKNADGDYIAFLDSDDVWKNDKIEKQIKVFEEKKDIDFIAGLRNNEKITFPYVLRDNSAKITLKKLLLKVVGQTSTALFKNKILKNVGFFDENQKYSEDANYWMKIAINHKMIILNEQLVITNNDYGQSGLSSNFKEMELGVQKNINELYELKKINLAVYIFLKFFSKFKYYIRTLKAN